MHPAAGTSPAGNGRRTEQLRLRRAGRTPARAGQRGSALLSALIAFLVVSVGLLGLTRGQSQLRLSGDLARQRSEAARLAQADIEGLRAFAALTGAAGTATWAAIGDATLDATPAGSPTAYALSRRVVEAAGYKSLRVTVAWNDSRGAAQQVRLSTVVARHDPAYAGALTQPRHGRPLATVRGRDVRVPFAAADLGDGRSALKLSAGGTQAVVFDNASGAVTGLCRVAAARRGADLALADLDGCAARSGSLVAGYVRFALGTAPSVLDANDRPLPFGVVPATADARVAAPVCGTDAHDAADGGERWASYVCVVAAASEAAAATPGRTTLAPAGWTLGAAAGQYRVCRYAAGTPSRQNFLVVAGPQACPGGTPSIGGGTDGTDGTADAATVAHQP